MEKTLKFIERSIDELHKTKFFKTNYGFDEVYYNFDASSGGQLVYNQYPYELIREAKKQGNVEGFFSYLQENCKEFLVDIDNEDFLDYAYEFVAKEAEYSKNDKEIAYGMIKKIPTLRITTMKPMRRMNNINRPCRYGRNVEKTPQEAKKSL